MKVIILAGGFGTRLAEFTETLPKPIVTIGNKPIIWHIMKNYSFHGHKDFYIALGYKASVIKEYFLHYRTLNSDFTVDLANGKVESHQLDEVDWKVTMVDTGLNSMTGGRVKRMKDFIGDETFLLTYGDGLSNVDINALLEFHKSHGKMVTVTAVHPTARFGELKILDGKVSSFMEKPQTGHDWINGGYFVLSPQVIDRIAGDATSWEDEPLSGLARDGQLSAFKHGGFWQPMDTLREKVHLNELWNAGKAPWKVWE